MSALLSQKYAELKTVAASTTNVDVIDQLMIDILQLLRQEFITTSGMQKAAYERAYSYLSCTVAAHQTTRQDTANHQYLSEMWHQVGRDIEGVLVVS